MDTDNRKILKNSILNGIKTVIGLIVPLISFPYITHILNVNDLGKYNFCASIISYFLLISGLGITTYAIREGTPLRDNKVKFNQFASEIFTLNLLTTCISYSVLIVCIIISDKLQENGVMLLILSVEIFFTTIGVSWVCNIFEDFKYITIRTIAFQFLSLIFLFVLVRTSEDVYRYVILMVLANICPNILNWFYTKKYVKFKLCTLRYTLMHLKPILIIFAYSCFVTIYVNSDITILGFMIGDTAVGLYSVPVKIYKIVKSLIAAVLVVIIPRFSLLIGKGCFKEFNSLFNRINGTIFTVVMPTMVGLISVSNSVVEILAGKEYSETAPALQVLCLSLFFSAFSYLLCDGVLLPLKKEKNVLFSTIVAGTLNILLNILLIPLGGYIVAAWTTLVAELTTFLFCAFYAKEYVDFTVKISDVLSIVFGCLAIYGWCFFANTIGLNIFATMLLSVFGSAILYCTILYLGRNSYFRQIVKGLKHVISCVTAREK